MENERLAKALDVMKENGFKYTKKREAILDFLISENKYTSAKEVYDFMDKYYTGISYDTIYRNLNDFSKMNLIEETELKGEKIFRFHCGHGEFAHHHHFICTNCGATREVKLCPMDYFKEQLAGCLIEGHRFEIFGKCSDCLQIA